MATIDASSITGVEVAPNNEETRRVKLLADSPESREVKFKLVAAYRMLADRGFDEGVAGHISMRVPGASDYFWVNPFGVLFEEITADKLALINDQGLILDGWPLINNSAFFIHGAIHSARPDVHCAVHTHSPAGAAFSSLGIELKMLDQVACSFYNDHGVYDEYEGVIVDSELATGIVEALGDKRALILVNHGLLTCASTIEQAISDFIDLERTCELNLRALATGLPIREVEGEAAEQARSVYTPPGRWPFMWQAYIRQLSRRIDIQSIAPEGWGGENPVPSVEDLRRSLSPES